MFTLESRRITLGISRNRGGDYLERRNTARAKVRRFQNKMRDDNAVIEMQTMKKPLVEQSTVSTIDTVRPTWMQHLEQCEALISSVEFIKKEMDDCRSRRMKCFRQAEEKQLEIRIYEFAKEATQKIKQCQRLMKMIEQQAQPESPADQKICNSICFRLAVEVQQNTRQIRYQQSAFIEQRKQMDETIRPSFLDMAVEKMLQSDYEQLVQDEQIAGLEERNEEIRKIVESIQQLNQIFKELNTLVIFQGTLLDRIDMNIEQTYVAIHDGTETLVKADRRHKKMSRCACIVTSLLLVAIGILTIILVVRWQKK